MAFMNSKIFTAPGTDARDMAIVMVVVFLPAAAWLACGVAVSCGKTVVSQFVHKAARVSAPPKRGGQAQAAFKFVFNLVFQISCVMMDTILGVGRTLIAYTTIMFLFLITIGISYVMLHYSAHIIRIADTLYEAIRPNAIESILQIFNFTRVLFAILAGAWNAVLQMLFIPVKLIFDAGFECGGATFVQDVVIKSMRILQEFAKAITGFFTLFSREDRLYVDVTALCTCVREFLIEFVKVTECSCEAVAKPLIRTALAPLWNNMTDVFVNSATGAVVKAVEIMYVTLTGGTTTFEPLFEVLLLEKNGTLAAGAEVLNDHLKTVIDLIQNETIAKLPIEYHTS
jgi:hypothetical protein